MSRFVRIAFATYLIAYYFEAPLRYVLYLYGLETGIYSRDAILVLIVALLLPRHMTPKVNMTLAVMLYALLSHLLVGFFYLPVAMQALFGMKLYMPLLLGVVTYPLLRNGHSEVLWFSIILFLGTAGGLFLNYFMAYPWEGFSYYVAGKKIPGSYVWWHYGTPRLAGFTRASFDAAINCLAAALVVIVRARTLLTKLIVWIAAGVAIALTTSKGVILAHAVITLIIFLQAVGLGHWKIFQRSLIPITVLIITAPLISIAFYYLHVKVDRTGWIKTLFLGSYIDRIEDMWPRAFKLLSEHGNYLLGRGLGGIGTPQYLYEPLLSNAADNMFVMMYTTFGVFSVLYLGYFVRKARMMNLSREHDLMFSTFVLFTLVYGLTTGVFDSAIMGVVIGMTLAHLGTLVPYVSRAAAIMDSVPIRQAHWNH